MVIGGSEGSEEVGGEIEVPVTSNENIPNETASLPTDEGDPAEQLMEQEAAEAETEGGEAIAEGVVEDTGGEVVIDIVFAIIFAE